MLDLDLITAENDRRKVSKQLASAFSDPADAANLFLSDTAEDTIDALVAEIERLQEEVERLREANDHLHIVQYRMKEGRR